jgi:hydroxymethylbilane synthase
MRIRIGTRKSQLAMWQTEYVAGKLREFSCEVDILPIETKGDQILDRTISKIGSKGVFTEELEQMLRDDVIDIAVHSAKDLQSRLPDDLSVIAFTEREPVHDVIIGLGPLSPEDSVLGTSSTRRVAFLKHYIPKAKVVDMRGNLQTRFKKLKAGTCQGLVLAYAGVNRMGMNEYIVHEFDHETFIPAVGQGCIAVQAHHHLNQEIRETIRSAVNHELTEKVVLTERSFLSTMDGGCSIPIFGLAQLNDSKISIEGGIISLSGEKLIKDTCTGENSEEVGRELAERILQSGGDQILKEIRKELNN